MSLQEEILRRRTFAIISHPDAGKTTMTEKLLLNGGVIREAGEVKAKEGKKSATSDWMALEQQKGISITSSVMQFDFKERRVNLLDTPGHKDFGEDTYRTLVAADSALMLIDAAKGVEERTKKLYEVCRYRKIPIFTFINKMDREAKSTLALIDDIERTLGQRCYPINWPIGMGERFQGVYYVETGKVIWFKGRSEKEEEQFESFEDSKLKAKIPADVYEQALEEITLMQVACGSFSREEFMRGEVSPVMFGTAKFDFGVDLFLDYFVDLAPAPQTRATRAGEVDPIKDEFSGFVFKIQANMDKRHRDRVAFLRICSGKFERGMKVQHARLKRELRLAYSTQFVAQERETVNEAFAGDIIGVNDSGNFQIGDTVSVKTGVIYDDIPKFAPELFARVSVPDAMKRKKLQDALTQLAQEGAIQIFIDPLVGHQDPIVGVVGELQFEVLLYRMQDEYGLEARLHRMPYSVARWPRTKEGKPWTAAIKGSFFSCRDLKDQLVILLEKEWDLNWAKKENPDIEFMTSLA